MDNQVVLGLEERLDDLLIGNLKIIQHEKEFCFSLDAVLLSHFATVRPGAKAVDLGTGTGVISLILATRGIGHVIGLELSQSMAAMASRSVNLNKLDEKVTIMQGDLCKVKDIFSSDGYDLVVSNPPYRPVGGGHINPNDKVAMARHEVTATLEDVINAARYLLKYRRGRFAMVHLPERMAEILTIMSQAGIEPKRLQLVYSSIDKKPTMLLVEGIRGANPGLEVLPPLIVYKSDGSYSEEITKYYKEYR
ncbi:tRNA1(Val) (adenine(37)-N6)-methyltransferase [Pelosinus sp. IPA-1]|uniref:tRNA1(Val) (adenine(37)-N6)-methyltransferase n=1 Tax=Pelosinus sp. IPA-1 TaxID=3029569 RepID=UPI00243623C3|nr:tRNA1(Val) (adenine(37)-N6)-methyltransferase [Pelosinus sp. IPA-1]GMB01403.1 methyltransferase [Pelosinus sp. IPA-1]